MRGVLPFRRFGLRDAPVGFGLRRLQFGADVLADVDVGDVDRNDFESGSGVEALGEHGFADAVGILEDFLVVDAAPTAETTPSPTRATIVCSPAPPT